MSETKYTPGPWSEGAPANTRVYGPDGSDEHSGCVAIVFKGRANTQLISAAPDLLEALKDELSILAQLAGPCQKGLVDRCRCGTCRNERSKAAIAKAEGRTA